MPFITYYKLLQICICLEALTYYSILIFRNLKVLVYFCMLAPHDLTQAYCVDFISLKRKLQVMYRVHSDVIGLELMFSIKR